MHTLISLNHLGDINKDILVKKKRRHKIRSKQDKQDQYCITKQIVFNDKSRNLRDSISNE